MVVDGIDDEVNMAYSAWPERLYVLKPDGTIHYRGDLGPAGFDPQEAADAVAELLGEEAPDLDEMREAAQEEAEEPEPVEDDGFSGLWEGSGTGRIMAGDIPIRLHLALGDDGTVGGRAEVTNARYPLPLRAARYDAASGALTARVSIQGRPVELKGTVLGQTLSATLTAANGPELMQFEANRVSVGAALVPGVKDASGVWLGTALAGDPALAGRAVRIVLDTATSKEVTGSVTLGDVTATIQAGRYDAKTGALACRAEAADGPRMRVAATLTAEGATGRIALPPALVVSFVATREVATED